MVTIDLNDEKTKLKLLSILYSNYNGDIPNNEVEEEVNKQLDNSNTDPIVLRAINSSELNNKRIAIKVLSNDEYENYIVKGTCDGSITEYDINVWNYHNMQKTYIGYGNAAIPGWCGNGVNGYVFVAAPWWGKDGNVGEYIVNAYYEICEDNNNINFKAIFKNVEVWCRVSGYRGQETHIYLDNKTSIKTSNIERTTWEGSGVDCGLYVHFDACYSFRPVFQFTDNTKSKNLYY